MPTVAVFDMTGKKTGEMELNEAVFGIEPNMAVVHAAVKNYLANQRQGTQSTLTRAEVRGGGIKPWRQKGTGRTRHMGIRPTVRGSVMNPCDHPHGGGEGKSPIGRPSPVTPWGKPAMGYKTRKKNHRTDKQIVRRRNGK